MTGRSSNRTSKCQPVRVEPFTLAQDKPLLALVTGFQDSTVGLCLADESDLVRYANPAYRASFFPHHDGTPKAFVSEIVVAIKAGTGIKLDSAHPDDFAGMVTARRRDQIGSRSFTVDTCNGRWWWVTDTKLANGWMMAVAQEISGLKQEEFRLRDAHASAVEEAQTDDLTGAPNRRRGLRQGETLFGMAQESNRALSIALMDIDHFKAINDVHGHETGDRALVHFARWMLGAVRPDGHFSRVGGDEFLLVLPEATPSIFEARLAALLNALPPLDLARAGQRLRLSISVGIAGLTPNDSWSGLMRKADTALYDAKAGGRNRIAVAGRVMSNVPPRL